MPLSYIARDIDYVPPPGQEVTRLETHHDDLFQTTDLPRRAWNRPLNLPPEDPTLGLCARHCLMDLKRSDFGPRPFSQQFPPDWYLGTYNEVAARGSWCKMCQLIAEACDDIAWPDQADTVMSWVRDVRWRKKASPDNDLDNGVESTETWETLRLAVRSTMIGRAPAFTPFDLVPLGREGEPFQGRRLDEGQIDIDRVMTWLKFCREWHGTAQQSLSESTTVPTFGPFIRLIDLEENCLVERNDIVPYVALSYVWGRVEVFKTREENIDELRIPGGILEKEFLFPRSLRDAMTLARRLGYRYIWIDSICIIQNDDTDTYKNLDKRHQIGQMGKIYQYADLTIVAASGEDANAGLPGVEPGTREAKQKQVKISEDLTIMNRSRAWPDALLRTTWEERGWTYQERILSLRYMYFVDDTVHFQCQQAAWSEDFAAESPDLDLSAADQVVNFSIVPTEVPPTVDLRPNLKFQLKRYPELVGQYTCRNMTFITDRVNGIQGILNVIKDHFFSQDVEFVHGMPTGELLHPGLLWRPRLEPKRIRLDERKGRPLWPSWAWAGWTVPVYYDYGADFSANSTDISLGPDPYFLHLKARVARFRLMIEDRGNEDAVPPLPRVRPTRLTRYAITHATNPDGGSIWLTWSYRRKFVEHELKLISKFIILSDADGFEREELVQAATAEKRAVVNEDPGTDGRVRIERAGVGRMYRDAWDLEWERFELG
ncbi:LOW QUALITY PROTEIN: heterokaryon incompatibility protein-domain-containing protein [Neurospora tetraspora]|uniref:Heterokaryon incompatibility protein-domain-containing protein n=1 Tax=Neurospora tetraspora TaxID=94610 RepID=A0AAE0JG07_9PEZI|nr:LOW QUALITY PROTEIN: heterokaryon incompatibility protein-domain-containing protein [Neurospora tetraspora]